MSRKTLILGIFATLFATLSITVTVLIVDSAYAEEPMAAMFQEPDSRRADPPDAVPSPSPALAAEVRSPDQVSPDNAVEHSIKTVFLILMENTNWSLIEGSDSAPYIKNTLLPIASYAREYYRPPGVHPSEPNYLWLEAGTDFGIKNDGDPNSNHQSTTRHLTSLLEKAGISWKSYQEDIPGAACPLKRSGLYAPKHNPMVYFEDVTNTNDPNSVYCIARVRPYSELAADLRNNTVARYNFITPNLCNDMHNTHGCQNSDRLKSGDDWLAREVPMILNSRAFADGGVLIITWDEGEQGSDGPIGLIVLSPKAKGGGYSNTIHYTHSSTLRTLQEIFGVTPLLGDAANAANLSDLFTVFP